MTPTLRVAIPQNIIAQLLDDVRRVMTENLAHEMGRQILAAFTVPDLLLRATVNMRGRRREGNPTIDTRYALDTRLALDDAFDLRAVLGGQGDLFATLVDLAKTGTRADFDFLARSSGVEADRLDDLWAGTRARLGLSA